MEVEKPLYGLDDASRKIWLRVKEILKKMGLKVLEGDEAFYYLHKDGILVGGVITNVDDLILAHNEVLLRE